MGKFSWQIINVLDRDLLVGNDDLEPEFFAVFLDVSWIGWTADDLYV